jgi:hypothetical protein
MEAGAWQLNPELAGRRKRMAEGEDLESLEAAMWAHIAAERFVEAEIAVRRLLKRTDPEDRLRRWNLIGIQAGVLNSLSRPNDATQAFREALTEATRAGATRPEVQVSRYMLANQHLLYGDPMEALAEAEPIPSGTGHTQCLLHSCLHSLHNRTAPWKARCRRGGSSCSAGIDTPELMFNTCSLSERLPMHRRLW